jgi:hypothetical protein
LKSKVAIVFLLAIPFKIKRNHILSSRFYDLAGLPSGILKKGREVFLTGCYLRTATESSGHPRLLPTEYFVILLDEVTISFYVGL